MLKGNILVFFFLDTAMTDAPRTHMIVRGTLSWYLKTQKICFVFVSSDGTISSTIHHFCGLLRRYDSLFFLNKINQYYGR